jgi:hypothetical protein
MTLLLALTLLLAEPPGTSSQPRTVDLCSVVGKPEQFDGRRIKVTAYVAPGPHYRASLGDSRCPGRMALAIPTSLDDKPAIRRLRRLVWRGFPDTVGQPRATGVFTGTFHVAAEGPPLRTFILEKAENVAPMHESTKK